MVAVVILAAGEASRMGQPKQLMRLQGQTLVQRTIQTARLVSQEIVVVTGAHYKLVQKEVERLPVAVAHNAAWSSGMGSSISAGVSRVKELHPAARAVIVMLCDQPLVNEAILEELLAEHRRSGKEVVASTYEGVVGVPALFGESLLSELIMLDGEIGAQKLIARHTSQLAMVNFSEGIIDVDTPEDFARLQDRFTDQ